MANPQKEEGHTALANEIWDALARYRLSGEEWQCLIVIFRKTYGWQKKEDAISLSQFCLMTGMKRPHVVRAIRKLQQKTIIIVIKNDNTPINTYRFNKDFDTWKPLSKKITTFMPESSLKKQCYICQFSDAIEEHHIIPKSQGGSNRAENKIILCPNCHALVHKGKYNRDFLVTQKDNIESVTNFDNSTAFMALSKKIPTKEILTKETLTKEIHHPSQIEILSKHILETLKIPMSDKGKTEELLKTFGLDAMIYCVNRMKLYFDEVKKNKWKNYIIGKHWRNLYEKIGYFSSDENLYNKLVDTERANSKKEKVDCRTVSTDFSSDEEIMRKQREKKND